MTMKTMLIVFLVVFAIAPFAVRAEKSDNSTEITKCPPIAAQVCTMEFSPVCAKLDDEERKTYSNGCVACSDANVVSWTYGACDG